MSSKKFELQSFTLPYDILKSLQHGAITPSDLVNYCKKPKQNIHYWLEKLCKESLVNKPHHGFYDITESGKNLLRTLVKKEGKDLIRLENMRFKYPIRSGMENLIPDAFAKKYYMLNNVRVYQGKEYDHSYRIFATNNNPCLEITCPPRYGDDIYEMYYYAREDNEAVAEYISGLYTLELGPPKPSMKPEWAIPSPMAEGILKSTYSSQIRTSKGAINRSKGRKADLETRDIRLAHQLFKLPETLDELSHNINKLTVALSQRAS